MSSDDTTLETQAPPVMATEAAEPDLVDRMRRLSVGSTTSSYSFISEAPSVLSLDTDSSVNGGVSLNPPSIDVLETCLEALTVADSKLKSFTAHDELCADTTRPTTPTSTSDQPDIVTTGALSSLPSPYWLQFAGFEPSPTAGFKKEFGRLAKHENWSNQERRRQQVKALAAEIAHHYGTHMNKLDRWQQLCEDVGIDVVPKSITQCRKIVSPVLVNLYNVIDHRRNPKVKILRFKSYGQFVRYTRAGHTFPRDCAKQDNFINVFLRKI